ncbi:MAG: phage holin family protein [Bacilli bacterium]
MKVIIEAKKSKIIYKILDWFVYIIGYALILITVSIIFKKTIYIDNSYFGLWGLLAAIIINILNKTIKPLLIWLTLPITAITLGLFYPLINVFILNIVDFILDNHFKIEGFLMSIVVAVLISFMNFILGKLVIEPIIGGEK